MDITKYYSLIDGQLSFTREQASQFAKSIAGDFNPIHNVDARRFCVPGDLLFSILLNIYGVAGRTSVTFDGMINEDASMSLPESVSDTFTLKDASGRSFLTLEYSEEPVNNRVLVNALTEQYVQFSGQTFPDILVDLMQRENVMINPDRPLVIYKDMSIELDTLDAKDVILEFDGATLTTEGKKGEAKLGFLFKSNNKVIGKGQKTMLLRGLQPYEQAAIDNIITNYTDAKRQFSGLADVS